MCALSERTPAETAIVYQGNANVTLMQKVVTPVRAGVQENCNCMKALDPGFRRNDGNMQIPTFCVIVKVCSNRKMVARSVSTPQPARERGGVDRGSPALACCTPAVLHFTPCSKKSI